VSVNVAITSPVYTRIPGAFSWAVADPAAWVFGVVVNSYVISRNIDERSPNFGASGAIVYRVLTWVLLEVLSRAARERAVRETP
jgi:hypothetical protein